MTFLNSGNHKNRFLQGRGLSPGVGCGMAYRIETESPTFFRIRISETDVPQELERFGRAIATAREQYLADKDKFEQVMGKDHSYIIDAHLLMLEDRQLIGAVEERIKNRLESAERGLRRVAEQFLNAYRQLEDQFFKDRSFDFEEVIDRILSVLLELDPQEEAVVTEDLVLTGVEIGLSQLARFPLERVKGLVLTRAGENSHVVIVARSLQIPVVSGIENLPPAVGSGDFLVVDGTAGTVEVSGSPVFRGAPGTDSARVEVAVPSLADKDPCYTTDGERIWLYANTEFGSEVGPALDFGAEGIGLFRTEYIHLSGRRGQSEEDRHFQVYDELYERMEGRPVVIRTLDIAERPGQGMSAGEELAALGVRGIRLSLKKPELFKTQLRAILRARRQRNLRIVLPMITSVDEVLETRALISEVEHELGLPVDRSVSVGVLIEVPAAVLVLEEIVLNCDFVAVGTNDLIQYTLAASRINEDAAYLYNPFHPAVLRSLARIVAVCEGNAVPVMVCGELAARPMGATVLVGLGFRQLSMAAPAIPLVKSTLRQLSVAGMREWAGILLKKGSLAEIADLVHEAAASGIRFSIGESRREPRK